jgi:hypothetical protein
MLEYVAPPLELQIPAAGDAYDFTVTVYCVWADESRSPRAFERRCIDCEEQLGEMISVAARSILRCFAPDETVKAEDALNRRLEEVARAGMRAPWPRWSARAEVTAPEAVRDVLRRAWISRSDEAARYEYAREVIDKYSETISRWRRFLADLGIGKLADEAPEPFIAPHLVRLAAEPGKAADIIRDLAERREKKDKELLDKVFEAVRGIENVDVNLLEFEVAQGAALSRLMEWAGLPVPREGGAGAGEDG